MKRTIIIEIIAYAFILLFMYTALSKLFIYNTYVSDLERSPLIGGFARPLSILLPVIEIVISVLLFIPAEGARTRGLQGALGLMLLFTIYVSILVFTRSSLPCSCGGLIRELTWKQHFFFNIFFTGLAAFGLLLHNKHNAGSKAETSKAEIANPVTNEFNSS